MAQARERPVGGYGGKSKQVEVRVWPEGEERCERPGCLSHHQTPNTQHASAPDHSCCLVWQPVVGLLKNIPLLIDLL